MKINQIESMQEALEVALADAPVVISTEKLEKLLGQTVSNETFRLWRSSRTHNRQGCNHGPRFVRLGRKIGYFKSDVIEWLVSQIEISETTNGKEAV